MGAESLLLQAAGRGARGQEGGSVAGGGPATWATPAGGLVRV